MFTKVLVGDFISNFVILLMKFKMNRKILHRISDDFCQRECNFTED